jgi:hypothetical protein
MTKMMLPGPLAALTSYAIGQVLHAFRPARGVVTTGIMVEEAFANSLLDLPAVEGPCLRMQQVGRESHSPWGPRYMPRSAAPSCPNPDVALSWSSPRVVGRGEACERSVREIPGIAKRMAVGCECPGTTEGSRSRLTPQTHLTRVFPPSCEHLFPGNLLTSHGHWGNPRRSAFVVSRASGDAGFLHRPRRRRQF